ncbi:MAG: tRNA (guanosine(37)-N1)-methyltransferase TrmD [Bacilli bacterium]|nr:tRNA (guanosine(37)-N1)-methyltransferase TrmD [Bacilli bacterium]
MKIDIITIFDEMFKGIIENSIIKRAIEKGIVEINLHDFRSYTLDKHNRVDDTTYGGGAGMLIGLQAITDCLKSIEGWQNAHKIITSPIGEVYNQKKASLLSKKDHIIVLCGHYEGIDDRIYNYVDEAISIGDYILTGGEIAAAAIVDSIVRLIPDAIKEESYLDESFSDGLLEYPQYTKPPVYEGYSVPEVLINGNHEEIRKFRLYESIKRTYERRPDLLKNRKFSKEEEYYLEAIKLNMDLENASDYVYKKLKEYKKKQKMLEKKR